VLHCEEFFIDDTKINCWLCRVKQSVCLNVGTLCWCYREAEKTEEKKDEPEDIGGKDDSKEKTPLVEADKVRFTLSRADLLICRNVMQSTALLVGRQEGHPQKTEW